jgi:ribosomal subunit interface protein
MRIDIQTKGFALTEGLRQHTERRLQFALHWASHEVRSVTVRLSDINGPRGGHDTRCLIQIPIAGKQDVVIEDTESDIYVAISRAAERTDRTLARRLHRQREHRGDHRAETRGNRLQPDSSPATEDVGDIASQH